MPHLPTAEEQWGHWAEQAPTLPDPVVPETATQFSQRLDNLYAEYVALRREREAREHHWQSLNISPMLWGAYNPTLDDLLVGEQPYRYEMSEDKAKGYRTAKQPRHRLFNRRLPL